MEPADPRLDAAGGGPSARGLRVIPALPDTFRLGGGGDRKFNPDR